MNESVFLLCKSDEVVSFVVAVLCRYLVRLNEVTFHLRVRRVLREN